MGSHEHRDSRLRRSIATTTAVVTGAAAALALAVPTPATARATTVVDGTRLGAAGLSTARVDCLAPGMAPSGRYSPRLVREDVPSLGNRAITWTGGPTSTGAAGPLAFVADPTKVSTLAIQVDPGEGTTAAAVARFTDPASGRRWLGVSVLPDIVNPGWQVIDATGVTFRWLSTDPETGRTVDEGSQTLATRFAAQGDGQGARLGFALGCDGETGWLVDGLHVVSESADQLFDFEAGSTSVSASWARSALTYGQGIRVDTKVKTQQPGRRVEAFVERKNSDGSIVRVEDLRLSQAKDSFSFRPKVSGRYRVSLVETSQSLSSASPWKRISVRSKVKASPSTRSVRQGSTFKITGSVSPSASGTVTAFRKAGGRWVKAGSGRFSSGRFAFKVKATSTGQQSYRVRSSRTALNDPGTSSSFTLSVTAPPSGGGGGGGTGGGGGGTGGGGGGGEDPPDGPQRPTA